VWRVEGFHVSHRGMLDEVVSGFMDLAVQAGEGQRNCSGSGIKGRLVGIVEPGSQVSVGKEVESEHGIGEGPVGAGEEVQPFRDEQSQ